MLKCETSIAANSGNPENYFNLGNVLSNSARHAEAIEQLERAITLNSDSAYWTEAKIYLERAEAQCGEIAARRAEVASRCGLVHVRTERYDDAIENFRRALAVRSHDLMLRGNLGRALLGAKRLDAAEAEFDRVLKSAEGNIEARLGAAQVCVELGDDGDLERYKRAEEHLTKAIEFGRNKECGSKRLYGSQLAEVYYLRGYVRTKRYEKDSLLARLVTRVSPLHAALRDFRQCRREDPNHFKAAAAIDNITSQFRRQRSESLTEIVGPFFIFFAGLAAFVLTQLDFFFKNAQLHDVLRLAGHMTAGYYTVATFGALTFMVAGLSLPRVLKLKVGVIELQKTSIEQVSAPTGLNIPRSTGFKA